MINGNELLKYSFIIEFINLDKNLKNFFPDKSDYDREIKNYFFANQKIAEEIFFFYIIDKLKILKNNEINISEENFWGLFLFLFFIPSLISDVKVIQNQERFKELFKIAREYEKIVDNIIKAYISLEEPNLITLISFIKEINKQNYKSFIYDFFNKIRNFIVKNDFNDIYSYTDFFKEKIIIKKDIPVLPNNKKYLFKKDEVFLFFDTNFLKENIFLYFFFKKYPNEILFEKFKKISLIAAFFKQNLKQETEKFLQKFLLKDIPQTINFEEYLFTKSFEKKYNEKIIDSIEFKKIIKSNPLYDYIKSSKSKNYIYKEDFEKMMKNFADQIVDILYKGEYALLIDDNIDKKEIIRYLAMSLFNIFKEK